MSKHVKHVPKHRDAATRSPLVKPRQAVRTTLVLTSVAVAATGITIGGGVIAGGLSPVQAASSAGRSVLAVSDQVQAGIAASVAPDAGTDASPDAGPDAAVEPGSEAAVEPVRGDATPARLGTRSVEISRGDRRDATDPAKAQALAATEPAATSATESLSQADPRDIAMALLPEYGFSSDQFSCLDSLWTKESGWDVYADNPTSSAYGIPQSLPGSKMATAGPDYLNNPETQIRWGLGYIQDSYGSPCSAWGHSQALNWY